MGVIGGSGAGGGGDANVGRHRHRHGHHSDRRRGSLLLFGAATAALALAGGVRAFVLPPSSPPQPPPGPLTSRSHRRHQCRPPAATPWVPSMPSRGGVAAAAGRGGLGGGAAAAASPASALPALASKTGKEINQEILAREGSAELLLELLEAPGVLAAFDKVNCATFINRLSRAVAGQRRPPPQQQLRGGGGKGGKGAGSGGFEMRVAEGVEAVLGRTAALLPECDARQLANILNGLGKLGHAPANPHFIRAFAQQARGDVGAFSPQELANILHGLAILPLPPRPGSFKKHGHAHTDTTTTKTKTKTEEDDDATATATAAAAMWAEVDALMDVLVGEALPLLLVEAPARPTADGHPLGPQHQQQQQQQQQQRMSSQHVANVLYAMGRLNHQRHPEVLTALLTHITTGAGARAFFPPPGRDPLPYFPQHVANSLNALARLREGRRRGQQNTATSKGGKGGMGGVKGDDEKALAAAVERFRDRCAEVCLAARFSHFRARDLSATLNSLLRLGLRQAPAGFLAAVRERCYDVTEETNTQDISLLLNALARLRDAASASASAPSPSPSTPHTTPPPPTPALEARREEEATEALVVELLHRLLHDFPSPPSSSSSLPQQQQLTPQGMATVVNAASRLLPEAAAPALSFETLEHKCRLYRPLMLRACALLPKMDAQGLALTILGLGRLSEGKAGTREPIVGLFLQSSLPKLPSFPPRHLSAALHGLALFRRPPPVAYLDRTRDVALPRLSEFTAQQLVLTLHGMAQLGYHPGGPFLDAWAPALCQQMHAPASSAAGGSNRHNDVAAAAGMGDGEADHKQQDPWQNLSLAFVALAILQSPPPDCLWAEAQALLPAPDHNSLPPPPPRLIDVSSLLWALAALQFPPELPPALLEGLLGALKLLLLAVEADKGVVDKQAASQLKQFAMAVELVPHPSFDPRSPLWQEAGALIEERAWRPFDQARHRRRTREERARAALKGSAEGEEDLDDIITSPVQLEVEGLLDGLGFPHEAEVELGPYTLDVLVQQPPPAGGGEGDGDGRPPPMVVIEVDGASHFFQNLLDDAEREKTQPPKQKRTKKGGKAPRGQTALKRRILNALVQRGRFKGFVVVTTDEWAAATTDASKRALLSGKLAEAWGGQGASDSISSSSKKKKGSSGKSKSKVEKKGV